MKFITHNDEHVDINGTHLQGYIKADYSKLRGMLGESHSFDGYNRVLGWYGCYHLQLEERT